MSTDKDTRTRQRRKHPLSRLPIAPLPSRTSSQITQVVDDLRGLANALPVSIERFEELIHRAASRVRMEREHTTSTARSAMLDLLDKLQSLVDTDPVLACRLLSAIERMFDEQGPGDRKHFATYQE
jgi:hypothetical protein